MSNTIKLRSWGGVRAGQKATLDLPIGQTYHSILTKYEGVNSGEIKKIALVVNGDELDTYRDLEQLIKFNKYRGLKTTEDYFELNFERSELLERVYREVSAIGTGVADDPNPIATLSLEIDIASNAISPSLQSYAEVSGPKPSGAIRQTRHFVYDIAQSGEYEIYDIPRGPLVDQVFFEAKSESGARVNINSVELKMNNSVVFERTSEINTHIQKNGIRSPDDFDGFVFDPSEMGYGEEGLVTQGLQEMRFTLNVAAACRVTASVVYMYAVPSKVVTSQ